MLTAPAITELNSILLKHLVISLRFKTLSLKKERSQFNPLEISDDHAQEKTRQL